MKDGLIIRRAKKTHGKMLGVSVPPTPPSLQEILETPPSQLPRNRYTEAVHERETFWQIYFPLGVGTLLVIVAGFLAVVAAASPGAGSTRVWADVSLAFVILQVMIAVLPLLIVFGGLAYGIGYLIKLMPPYVKIAQDYTALASRKVGWAMRYVVEPVLEIKSAVAGFDGFVQSVRRFFGR